MVSSNLQEILKNVTDGRDLKTGDIQQLNISIRNQVNLVINGHEKDNAEILDAIHKAYLDTVPDEWFDWRPKAAEITDIFEQLEEIPNQNDSTPPLLKFIAHLVHQLKDSKKFQTFRENR